ncbi:MAG: amidase [Eubacterium sp.]|nr:amidase [Eubacterium sp.]
MCYTYLGLLSAPGRRPSSFSNLYGIRPSKGLTSISGVVPLMASRDTVCPVHTV